MSARKALRRVRRISRRIQRRPLNYIRWTPPQHAFRTHRGKRVIFRAGNQLGKSWCGLSVVIETGAERPGMEIWVVCTSWSQSVAIMRKFRKLCPKALVDERASSNYSERAGYGKDNPAVIFTNGTIVRFRTTNQGPEALQGATVDMVLIDEPTSQDIYRELDRRVMRKGGRVLLTMTPANRDCTWIREMVEAGQIDEVHARLTVENLTPIGAREPLRLLDGTLMDQAWIDEQWRLTPSRYAGVVLDGDWEQRHEGAFFGDIFDKNKHVHEYGLRLVPGQKVYTAIGIDYAAAFRDFGQCAYLVDVMPWTDEKGHPRQAVYVRDEVVVHGSKIGNREFAKLMLEMLNRHGLQWRDIYAAHGDNPVRSRYVKRSNIETMQALAKELNLKQWKTLQPRILNVKEGVKSDGSVDRGLRYLWEVFADELIAIHPRCNLLVDALETWDETPTHPAKDRIDALRYALKPWIQFRKRTTRTPIRVA